MSEAPHTCQNCGMTWDTEKQWLEHPCPNWPNPHDCCYDCGSTIPLHHTNKCDLAPSHAARDLPAWGATQWWTGSMTEEEYHEIINPKDGKEGK